MPAAIRNAGRIGATLPEENKNDPTLLSMQRGGNLQQLRGKKKITCPTTVPFLWYTMLCQWVIGSWRSLETSGSDHPWTQRLVPQERDPKLRGLSQK